MVFYECANKSDAPNCELEFIVVPGSHSNKLGWFVVGGPSSKSLFAYCLEIDAVGVLFLRCLLLASGKSLKNGLVNFKEH